MTWMSGERFLEKRRQFWNFNWQTPSDDNYFNQFRNTRTKYRRRFAMP